MLMCHIFPFGEIEKNEEIIIWGMGYVGKQYVEEIYQTKYCKILFAVDQKYSKIQFPCVEIRNPELIKEYRDIKIVIAQQNVIVADEIRNELLKWGIDEKRIIYRKSFIMLEDNVADEIKDKINQLSNDTNQIWKAVQPIDTLKNIFISMESDIRDGKVTYRHSKQEIAHYKAIHDLMEVKKVKDFPLTRIGNMHDGGYALVNTFRHKENFSVAYSFGISNDVSWDKDMSELGYDIFMYDHTIESLPEENGKFHFFKCGITGNEHESNENLKTLEQLIKSNNHAELSGMILKMDVEGAEYKFLNQVKSSILRQFDQIILELHFITDIDLTNAIVKALRKINITHQLVHIHANNFSKISYINGNAFPDSIEVLYVLKDKYEFTDIDIISDDLDKPCWKDRLEIRVSNWNQYNF